MFDEEDRLRDCPQLRCLLEHYAQVSTDEQAWQDRLAEMPGASRKELTELHGALLAEDWIEQNTGNVPAGSPIVAAACYRITAAGRLALRLADEAVEAARAA